MAQIANVGASRVASSPAELREERRFAELFEEHKRNLAYVLLAVILVIGGYWFYARSKALKEEHAETAYEQAMQSVQAGNIPLAQSDLKKAATRYAGTNGGAEAALSLARLYYEQGQWQQGITALQQTASSEGDMQFDARVLIAAGYEGLGQPAKALKAYQDATDVARFPSDKSGAKALAARAAEAAGDKATAIRLWTELSKDPKSGYAGEALVRLGELQAAAIKI